jgi:hypothetical protein
MYVVQPKKYPELSYRKKDGKKKNYKKENEGGSITVKKPKIILDVSDTFEDFLKKKVPGSWGKYRSALKNVLKKESIEYDDLVKNQALLDKLITEYGSKGSKHETNSYSSDGTTVAVLKILKDFIEAK